eukprot:TRINITY_DN14922_c0_g2_i1.p2 TRINITY_DN14922_c0_g2~~TRINITY_DN14922_c0_g2_i1.p2  ORF type:complete len:110 (+),score=13.38 TRINITY_DN14922_c0_g2_i1:482-811(+)
MQLIHDDDVVASLLDASTSPSRTSLVMSFLHCLLIPFLPKRMQITLNVPLTMVPAPSGSAVHLYLPNLQVVHLTGRGGAYQDTLAANQCSLPLPVATSLTILLRCAVGT